MNKRTEGKQNYFLNCISLEIHAILLYWPLYKDKMDK